MVHDAFPPFPPNKEIVGPSTLSPRQIQRLNGDGEVWKVDQDHSNSQCGSGGTVEVKAGLGANAPMVW